MAAAVRTVVFDFDLTLADSRAGFEACHRFAAEAMGLAPPDRDAAGRTIGTPLPLAFLQLYGAANAALAAEYTRLYQARADEVMSDLTVMLPGAADALDALAAAGLKLGLVSQKLRYRVEDVLRREELLSRFAVILGGDDVPAFKPDPRGIIEAVERLGATREESIYVGDTTIDAEAAANAGLRFVALLSGYASRADFTPFAPLATLESVAALPALLHAAPLVP